MKNETKLSREEKELLGKLYKEVVSRVLEAAKIVGRNLGKENFKVGAVGISTGSPIGEGPATAEYYKIITAEGFTIVDDHGHCVGIYSEKEGVCKPC
jgi:hypothetical protein